MRSWHIRVFFINILILQFRCLFLCKCDEAIKNAEHTVFEMIDNEVENTTNLDYENLDFTQARDQLFETREKWITFKKEENSMKKYQFKIDRIGKLNQIFEDAKINTIIEGDSCDMSCASNCIKPKLDFLQIAECLGHTCSCNLKIDLEQAKAAWEH